MFTIYQQKAYITVRTECLIYMSHTKFSHLDSPVRPAKCYMKVDAENNIAHILFDTSYNHMCMSYE